MVDNPIYMKIGPAGVYRCPTPNKIMQWGEKGRGRIAQIFIWHSKLEINSIQFQFVDQNNRLVMSERHGTSNGTKFDVVKLNSQTENISWVGGLTRFDRSLSSITFGTKSGRYGPFGGEPFDGYEEYNFQLGDGNVFGGFFGAVSTNYVTAIGFCLIPAAAEGVPTA